MDYDTLFDLTSKQKEEMACLLVDPTGVPTIMIIVVLEYQRLETLLKCMRADGMHEDGEGLFIGRISLAFGLEDAPSIQRFMNRLTDELKTFHHFQEKFPCTDRLIGSVFRALERKLSRVAQGKKSDFASGSSAAAASVKGTEGQGLDDIIANAIDTTMRDNPQGFLVNQVIGLLMLTAPNINVDDEDVKKLILEKCNAVPK